MPFLNMYQNIHKGTVGQAHKNESDKIMEATWWNDISSRIGYLYDFYHDDHKTQLNALNPIKDSKKVPIEIKFLQYSSQTYAKDAVTFHIQMKPGQECNVDYYDEFFKTRYGATFPIGLYIDIEDERGIYNRWLIVDKANYNVTQFPTFEILRCDYVLQYIIDGIKYQIAAVLRSQNSYNSGIWTDYKVTSPEDQQKFAVPLNRDTEKIFYNLRMLIDAQVLTEPRAWQVSKVNRVSPKGILCATLAQDEFDQHKDYIEVDDLGNVIGMWANYYDSVIPPVNYEEPEPVTDLNVRITYAGNKPEVKIGGSYKTLYAKLYNGETEIPIESPGTWFYKVGNEIVDSLIDSIDDGSGKIKIKFNGDLSYIGKILLVTYTSYNDIVGSIEVEIKRL